MLDVGLEAAGGFGVLGDVDCGTGEMSAAKLTLGKFPRERMGRRRKFFFTLLRSC